MSTCRYCGKKFTKTRRPTREHVVPRCMGGKSTVAVCAGCNHNRGRALDDKNFLKFIGKNPDEWERAASSTDRAKFALYVKTHPEIKTNHSALIDFIERHAVGRIPPNYGAAVIRRWLAKKERKARIKERFYCERGQRLHKKQRLYGLRAQELRPITRSSKGNGSFCRRAKSHVRVNFDQMDRVERNLCVTQIRSRIAGSKRRQRRVLKAKLKQLNMINWIEDHRLMMLLRDVKQKRAARSVCVP